MSAESFLKFEESTKILAEELAMEVGAVLKEFLDRHRKDVDAAALAASFSLAMVSIVGATNHLMVKNAEDRALFSMAFISMLLSSENCFESLSDEEKKSILMRH